MKLHKTNHKTKETSMKKIISIEFCDKCPHFDNHYYSFNQTCNLLSRKIEEQNNNYDFIIPDDCPLPNDTDTENTENYL